VVTESTESYKDSDEECWVHILSQNTANNIPEVKKEFKIIFQLFPYERFEEEKCNVLR
jgi:hypothetical protein